MAHSPRDLQPWSRPDRARNRFRTIVCVLLLSLGWTGAVTAADKTITLPKQVALKAALSPRASVGVASAGANSATTDRTAFRLDSAGKMGGTISGLGETVELASNRPRLFIEPGARHAGRVGLDGGEGGAVLVDPTGDGLIRFEVGRLTGRQDSLVLIRPRKATLDAAADRVVSSSGTEVARTVSRDGDMVVLGGAGLRPAVPSVPKLPRRRVDPTASGVDTLGFFSNSGNQELW